MVGVRVPHSRPQAQTGTPIISVRAPTDTCSRGSGLAAAPEGGVGAVASSRARMWGVGLHRVATCCVGAGERPGAPHCGPERHTAGLSATRNRVARSA